MLEITKHLVDILINNSSLDILLGVTLSDSRIYSWNPPFDVVYNPTSPAAIFYYNESGKRPYVYSYPQQLPDETYYFQVVSIDKTKMEQIAEIIFDLFDGYVFHTEHFSVKTMEPTGKFDSDFGGTPTKILYGKLLVFDLNNLFRRASASVSPSVSVSRSPSISPSISISISPSVSESISPSASPSS